MTDQRTLAINYARSNHKNYLDNLSRFIAIPSVSTDPDHKTDMQQAAEWVADQLKNIGASQVQVLPTTGHPVVFGELSSAVPASPTVLVYGHYDVQPADPLDLWQSGPFQPEVRGDNLFARGATDMKGQVVASVKAVEAILKTGSLPVNIKFLIEGEEEIGSPSLSAFIMDHKELLASDFALNPDTGMIAPDLPTITYALRGLAYFELRLYGPDHDLHSGLYGGTVHNPAQVLCELIAGMHDEHGRITLPGFYDQVRTLEQEERAELARLPMDEAFFLKQTGAPMLWGEAEYSPVERVGARPTLEINGLLSGYTGDGSKTVLPAMSMAKISCRLVPDQDPKQVLEQLRSYLVRKTPKTVKYEVIEIVGGPASISDRQSKGVEAMAQAMETVWGRKPLFKREGGSVPVVTQLQDILGIESVNCGFALPDDNMHSPNEKLHLPTWYRGIETLIHFFYNLS